MPLFLIVEAHHLTLSPQLILLSLNLKFSGSSTSDTFRLNNHTSSTIPPSAIKVFNRPLTERAINKNSLMRKNIFIH